MTEEENSSDRELIFQDLVKEVDDKLRTSVGNNFSLEELGHGNICIARTSDEIISLHALVYDWMGWKLIFNNILVGLGKENATLGRITAEFAKIASPQARNIWFSADEDEREMVYEEYINQNKKDLEEGLIGSLRIGLQGFQDRLGNNPNTYYLPGKISLN